MKEIIKRACAATLAGTICLMFFAGCRRKMGLVSIEKGATVAVPGETTAVRSGFPPDDTSAQTTSFSASTELTAAQTTAGQSEPQTEPPSAASAPEQTATAPARPEGDDVTLPIALPAANGVMEVSTDPQNEWIRTVSEARGLDPSLLAAVYAVPQSGQNYVFEFYNAETKDADNLRRVYLLTETMQIKSVASSIAAEREQISTTENWFCMNVLIKGVIFPTVQEKMN